MEFIQTTANEMGIKKIDVQFIFQFVEVHPELDYTECVCKLRRIIKEIHNGHFLCLAYAIGVTSSTRSMKMTINNNLQLCHRQN